MTLRRGVMNSHMRKALALPQGVGFCVPLPGDLLKSPAWLAMSVQCRKFTDALMAEHADHGGLENRNLKAPYDMLEARGMRRQTVLDAIVEAKALGLVDPRRGQRSYGSRRAPSVYRLTWLGTPDGLTPLHEWKAIKTLEQAETSVLSALEDLERERERKRKTRTKYAADRAAERTA
jgi:hypothetical protein